MDLLTVNDQPGEYPGSYYAAAAKALDPFPKLKGDVTCDVCVIGGGFTGLSTAYHLAKRGYHVVLLEAQRVGFGASGRNGGQVGQGQRLDQGELERLLGRERANDLWKIGAQSVELVRELASSDDVHTNFHPGIIHADHRERFVPYSRSYAEKMARDYDYHDIRFLEREEINSIVASPCYHGGTLDTRSGHIDPLELALGLARMATKAGARIFERSKVSKISPGSPALTHTDEGRVSASHIVLACNGYIGNLHNDVAKRVMPINNYIVASEPLGPEKQEEIIKGNVAVADSKFVVNYFRFSDDHRLLFGGTESYDYRFPRHIAKKVYKPLLEVFPQLADIRLDHAWGGTLAITMNRMPHFERYAGNILSISGFSGHGIALGTLSGQLAADAIAGQAERFDIMAAVPTPEFPGGRTLRQPLLVLAMLWYSLRDKI